MEEGNLEVAQPVLAITPKNDIDEKEEEFPDYTKPSLKPKSKINCPFCREPFAKDKFSLKKGKASYCNLCDRKIDEFTQYFYCNCCNASICYKCIHEENIIDPKCKFCSMPIGLKYKVYHRFNSNINIYKKCILCYRENTTNSRLYCERCGCNICINCHKNKKYFNIIYCPLCNMTSRNSYIFGEIKKKINLATHRKIIVFYAIKIIIIYLIAIIAKLNYVLYVEFLLENLLKKKLIVNYVETELIK